MRPTDWRRQVRNTQYLLTTEGGDGAPAAPIQFAAYCLFPSRVYAYTFALFGIILRLLTPFSFGRSLLKRVRVCDSGTLPGGRAADD